MGFFLIDLLEGSKKSLLGMEKAAIGWVVGFGVQSLYMFLIGMLGIRLNFLSCSALIWLIIAIGLIRFIPRRLKRPPRKIAVDWRFSWRTVGLTLLTLLIAWKVVLSFAAAVQKPTYFDDSVSIWNYKAKVFYNNRALVLNPDNPDFLGGLVQKYPPGIPLFKAWIAICSGQWGEGGANLITWLFFLSLIGIAYANYRVRCSAAQSLLLTYILISIPLLTFHTLFAYVDLIIVASLFASVAYLYRWIQTRKKIFLVISALIIAQGVFSKDEGLVLMVTGVLLPLGLYLILEVRRFMKMLKFFSLFLGLVAIWAFPWYAVKIAEGFPISLPPEYRRLVFHPEVLPMIKNALFLSGNFNILFLVAFISIAVNIKKIILSSLRYPAVAWAGAFSMTIYPFIFSPFFEFTGTAFNRAALTSAPLLVFLTCLIWLDILNPDEKIVLSR